MENSVVNKLNTSFSSKLMENLTPAKTEINNVANLANYKPMNPNAPHFQPKNIKLEERHKDAKVKNDITKNKNVPKNDAKTDKNKKPGEESVKKSKNKTIKHSLGIALARKNAKGNYEMLLVQKRYTYAFCEFVHGKYTLSGPAGRTFIKEQIKSWLNQMTMEEKLDILSFNFNQMWYRIWLNAPKNSSYITGRNKFEAAFTGEGIDRLKKLISKSQSGKLLWEIPKGRKSSRGEFDIDCAVREFTEETNILKKQYHIYVDGKVDYGFSDAGVKYRYTYYIAFTRHEFQPAINFNIQSQVDEISDIRWLTAEEIHVLNPQLKSVVSNVFNYLKNKVNS